MKDVEHEWRFARGERDKLMSEIMACGGCPSLAQAKKLYAVAVQMERLNDEIARIGVPVYLSTCDEVGKCGKVIGVESVCKS